jgi:hypothetical protein
MKKAVFKTLSLVAMILVASCTRETGVSPEKSSSFDALVKEAKSLPVLQYLFWAYGEVF